MPSAGGVVEPEAVRVGEVGVGHQRQRLARLAHGRFVAGARAEDLDDVGRLAPVALADHEVVAGEVAARRSRPGVASAVAAARTKASLDAEATV